MQLSELEAELDQFFSLVELPTESLYLSRWYCLIVTEDAIRNLFHDHEGLPPQSLGYLIDQTKYALKHVLLRAERECRERGLARLPREVVPSFYVRTSKLYFAGIDYARAHRLVASIHSGFASLAIRGERDYVVSTVDRRRAPTYAALELLAVQNHEDFGFSAQILEWMRNKDLRPPVIDLISNSVKRSKRLLYYTYNLELALQLVQNLSQQVHVIPEDWIFDWGDRHKTTLLLNALSVRLIYHLIAIHFGAIRLRHTGLGHEDLVLVTSTRELANDIKLMSSVDDRSISSFINALTYGSRTTSPDPALQPLIPAGGGRLLIAPSFWLSSNLERNLLSLQARRDSSSFDMQSGKFEQQMFRQMDLIDGALATRLHKNITLRSNGGAEQIDFLIFDSEARAVLLCEMRAMIQPGDPREVLNRRREVQRKVIQIQRKLKWVTENPSSLFDTFGILVDGEWTIRGLVTLAGYGGAASETPDIEVLPFELLLAALRDAPTLAALLEWIDRLGWQPKENEDYQLIENDQLLPDGPKIISEGIEVLISPENFFIKALDGLRARS